MTGSTISSNIEYIVSAGDDELARNTEFLAEGNADVR